MRDNHKELAEQLGSGRVDWRVPMGIVHDLGLTDEHGQKPTLDTVRRTWARVRRKAITKTRSTPALGPQEIAQGVRIVDTTNASRSVESPSRAPVDIRPARPLTDFQAAGGPETHSAVLATNQPAAPDAEEQIRKALEEMSNWRIPMPRQS